MLYLHKKENKTEMGKQMQKTKIYILSNSCYFLPTQLVKFQPSIPPDLAKRSSSSLHCLNHSQHFYKPTTSCHGAVLRWFSFVLQPSWPQYQGIPPLLSAHDRTKIDGKYKPSGLKYKQRLLIT